MNKEKECRFGHQCTSGCQNDFDCPCLSEHCCAMSEEVCDGTCDDCYFNNKSPRKDWELGLVFGFLLVGLILAIIFS